METPEFRRRLQDWLAGEATRLERFRTLPTDLDGQFAVLRDLQRLLHDAGWIAVQLKRRKSLQNRFERERYFHFRARCWRFRFRFRGEAFRGQPWFRFGARLFEGRTHLEWNSDRRGGRRQKIRNGRPA